MTALILDTGAFIAIERHDREMAALLRVARERSWTLRTNGGVVAEVWRGGSGKQATLARLLKTVEVLPVDDELGRHAGLLLKETGAGNAIDAVVVSTAEQGDCVVTSDPNDIQHLIDYSGRRIAVVPC
jgi:predicted nucleic acid-binding protein